MSDALTRILEAAPRCVRGCSVRAVRAVRNGFCEDCAAEIEQDIDFGGAAAPFVRHGRIYYAGQSLPDRFGGSPE